MYQIPSLSLSGIYLFQTPCYSRNSTSTVKPSNDINVTEFSSSFLFCWPNWNSLHSSMCVTISDCVYVWEDWECDCTMRMPCPHRNSLCREGTVLTILSFSSHQQSLDALSSHIKHVCDHFRNNYLGYWNLFISLLLPTRILWLCVRIRHF